MTTIGIDLGTTNSCVAIFLNGKVEIIPNNQGDRITPSVVAFTDEVRLVGKTAKDQSMMNAKNTIFNVKRLMGQKFLDNEVQEDIQYLSYKVVEGPSGRAIVEVEYRNELKQLTPEEISGMILTELKKTAEKYLGYPVKNAVITVPAYFNDSQRQATKDAGKIAGFQKITVLNEPTAAAIAYGMDQQPEGRKNILVYDLGGGTFDVTILSVDNGNFDVKSTSGNVNLGGEDFDNRVVDYFVDEISKRHKKDIKTDPRAMRRLRTACEKTKRMLSFETESRIELEALIDDINFISILNRTRLETLCIDLFEGTLTQVEDALSSARMDKMEINDIVLVGGSTRIPKVRQLLSEFFDGKKLSESINPDEAVANGAAIRAAILDGDTSTQNIVLHDVAPLSLGTRVLGDIMAVIIERNTRIPTKKTVIHTTISDYQRRVAFKVYEGQRLKADENHLLGTFELEGIEPAPRGIPKIAVTFEIDEDGILNASAVEMSTGKETGVVIRNDNGRLSEEEIRQMIMDGERYKTIDGEYVEKMEARNRLVFLIHDVKRVLMDEKNLDVAHKKELENVLLETEEWLEKNKNVAKKKFNVYYEDLNIALEKLDIDNKCDSINNVD